MSTANNAESERHLQVLLGLLCELADTLEGKINISNINLADGSNSMPRLFALRQVAHARTIGHLGANNDVSLVARSMMEGMFNALWAEKDWPIRAERWRHFAQVYNWKVVTRDPTPEHTRALPEIERSLKDAGFHDAFLTKKKKHPPQDWRDKPLRQSVLDIETEVVAVGEGRFWSKGRDIYELAYEQHSAWHHWDIYGFGRIFQDSSDAAPFPTFSMHHVLGSVVMAFQSLAGVAQFADRRLQLGITDEIEAQVDTFCHEAQRFAVSQSA